MMEMNQAPSPSPLNPLEMDDLDQLIENLINSAPPIFSRPFEDVCEYIENRSVTFKLFRNEFSLPVSTTSHKRKNKLKNQFAHEHEKPKRPTSLYFVPLPFNRSFFSIEEMEHLYAVYTASPTTQCPTNSQLLTYKESLNNIQVENSEYLQHIKRRWLEESWTRINAIKEHVTHFVSIWWKARINRVRNYAESYSVQSPIPLTPSDSEGKLVFLRSLKKYGAPSRYYSTPNNHIPYSLSVVHGELMKRERGRIKQRKSNVNVIDKEVNDDHLAERFAVDHQAQIVTTPSILATVLANTPGTFEESWCIPFTVKEFNSGDQHRKIIFMDKKLPPKALSISEKNSIFYKAAVRAIFMKSKNSLARAIVNNTAEQLSNPGATDAIDPESDGEECEDEAEMNKLYSVTQEEKADGLEPATKKKRLREEISYDLWEYSAAEEHSVLSKHHRKPFKILLKTTTKGKNFDSQQKLLSCVLTTKLEYQPEYGASAMSFRELMTEWVHLKLRPEALLHRLRVDPMKGDTVMLESKTATTVANDCQRLHSRCVRHQLTIIQGLFDHLSPLPAGRYLLNHEPKDKGFMYIFHELQDKKKRTLTNLNIWEDYNLVDTNSHAEQTAPWNPIDPTIMTPTLYSLKRIPCVFPPSKRGDKKIAPKEIKKRKKKTSKKIKKEKALALLAKKESDEQNQSSVTPCDTSRELLSYDGMFDE